MTQYRIIRHQRTGEVLLARARWCASFWCHLRGLQFVFQLAPQSGLLFVLPSESIFGATIHMFFVFMNIGVVWLDSSGQVVDKKLARPWRPVYAPRSPARYYIEASPSLLSHLEIGDSVSFNEVVE